MQNVNIRVLYYLSFLNLFSENTPYRARVRWVQAGGGRGVKEDVRTPREKEREWGR